MRRRFARGYFPRAPHVVSAHLCLFPGLFNDQEPHGETVSHDQL